MSLFTTITQDLEEHPGFAILAGIAAAFVGFTVFHHSVTGQTTQQSASSQPPTVYYGVPTTNNNNYYPSNPGQSPSPTPPTGTPIPQPQPTSPYGSLPPGFKATFGTLFSWGGRTWELGPGGNGRIWGVPLAPGQLPYNLNQWNSIPIDSNDKQLFAGS